MEIMKRKSVTYSALDVVLTGKRIDGIIKDNECSVKELQTILNLSCPQSIYRWIRGRALPSVDNLYMMSKIFEVHMEDMLVAKSTGIEENE